MSDHNSPCNELNKTVTELAVLQNVVYKIDNTVAEIAKASTEVSRLLIVHDNRLNNLENNNKETNTDVKDLYKKMEETTKEIVDKLDDMESRIENKLKEHEEKSNEYKDAISDRISALETWRWLVIGGAIVVGYLLDHSDVLKLFK
jgi:chromosome segregation ATPase